MIHLKISFIKRFFLFIAVMLFADFLFAQVSINSFSPVSGPTGTTVNIKGTGFDAFPGNNYVYFGAVRADVISSTDNLLSVTVPSGATYHPITVTTGTLTAYAGKSFIVTFQGSDTLVTSNSFAPKADFPIQDGAADIAIGDFDNDGKADMVTANYSGSSISILKNASGNNYIFFANKIDYSTPGKPTGITVSDFDGDGRLDIAVSNELTNLSIFINKTIPGNIISFSTSFDLGTLNYATDVAAGDLDGDGRPDIAVVNNQAGRVSVYRNTSTPGNTSFTPAINFPTSNITQAIDIGDINNDKKPEIVITNYFEQSLSVLKNTSDSGNISFETKKDFPTGIQPIVVSINDLDGDGKKDLLVGNSLSNTISILKNKSTNAKILFEAKTDYTTGPAPYGVAVTDLDGDGKVDIAVGNYSNNTISVFRNNGAKGTISYMPKTDFAAAGSVYAVGIADFDGDSRPDIAAALFGPDYVSVFKNQIHNPTIVSFDPKTGSLDTTVTIKGTNLTSTLLVNFGGMQAKSFSVISDSVIRAIVGEGATGSVSVYTAYGSASKSGFTFQKTVVTIQSFFPLSGPVGTSVEIKGKGFSPVSEENIVYFGSVKAEVVDATSTVLHVSVPAGAIYQSITVTVKNITGYSHLSFTSSFNNENNKLDATSFSTHVDFDAGDYPQHTIIGDYNSDGKCDIGIANYGTGFVPETMIGILKNTSIIGNISMAEKIDYTAGKGPYNIASGDIDGDGKLDLIVANANDGTISVFLNTSINNAISFTLIYNIVVGSIPESISVRDMNADGKPDIIVTSAGDAKVFLLRNTSEPNVGIAFVSDVTLPVLGSVSLVTGDIDGDNKPDIAVANGNNTVWVLRNISITGGDLQFETRIGFATGSGCYNIAIGDLDKDGKLDLITPNDFDNSISVLRNTSTIGTVSFASKTDYTVGYGPLWASAGDLNGDGMPDLAIANTSDASFSILTNNSIPGSISFAKHRDYTTNPGPKTVAISDIDGDGKNDVVTVNADKTLSVYRNNVEVVLLINLLRFYGKLQNNNILLQWETATEKNTYQFLIERSADGNLFTSIGNIAASGNSDIIKSYSFEDKTPKSGYNYYRLKMIDKDGKYSYSKIVQIYFNTGSLIVSPNPAINYAVVKHPISSQKTQIILTDLMGKRVKIVNVSFNTNQTTLDLTALSKGIYIITLKDAKNSESKTLIIQ